MPLGKLLPHLEKTGISTNTVSWLKTCVLLKGKQLCGG